jgi:regulator of sirC expression with transglutaminase-like and TPR domain
MSRTVAGRARGTAAEGGQGFRRYLDRVDITDRFAELVRGPEDQCRIDLGAFLVAAHAHRDLDVDDQLIRLDELASGCATPTLDGLCEHLFGNVGFQGDTEDYRHPRNSLLDVVLDRRRGIPITLAVVVMEVGRRLGLELDGVGMPGHFLVRDRDQADRFVDPFHQEQLDRGGCEKLFTKLHGPEARFEDRFLDPVGPRAIMARVVTNLQRSYVGRDDRAGALWAQCLRVVVPGATVGDRRRLAALLAANGRFDAAAKELEAIADDGWGGASDRHAATAMRARLN